tara:strand:- start:80 stop:229 length:150 start_codon:yes stop_codon:yes gene_type:complete
MNYQSFETQHEAEHLARLRSNNNHYACPEKQGGYWVVRVWDEFGNNHLA